MRGTDPAGPHPLLIDPENIDIEGLGAVRRYENVKAIAYKTVDTFSGITKRKLWLRNGAREETDGHMITVPFEHPQMFRLVEHALAHVLGGSDAVAKAAFVAEYTKRIVETAQKEGVPFDPPRVVALQQGLDHIINVLEDHRVESIWGLFYEGSYVELREMAQREVGPFLALAHSSLLVLLSCLEADLPVPPGKMDRFRPLFAAALRKVERRGFDATLLLAKWTVTNLVSEVIRVLRGLPPPPPIGAGQRRQGQGPHANPSAAPAPTPSVVGTEAPRSPEARSNRNEEATPQAPVQQGECGAEGGGTDGGADDLPDNDDWTPPPDTSRRDRAEALQAMVDMLGGLAPTLQKRASDVAPPKFHQTGAQQRAQHLVEETLRANTNEPEVIRQALAGSGERLRRFVAQTQTMLRQKMNEDDWIRRDAQAKVVFRDVRKSDVVGHTAPPLASADVRTVNRLRAIFSRIMGRKRTDLDDIGVEVDIPAYIERKVTGLPLPVFRGELPGRGFDILLLLDRSSSMGGDKKLQVERACRIVNRALDYPFANVLVWGFQSLEAGQTDIARYDPALEIFDAPHARVGGNTPLHVATRVAIRALEMGTNAKHLVLVTDGFPNYSRRDGKQYNTSQLMLYVRDEVRRARRHGIRVTAGMIGAHHWRRHGDVHYATNHRQLQFMFGSVQHWRLIHPDRLGSDLVRLASSSFLSFLRDG